MTICHIVPAIPPEFNGLGDYCYQLWVHWPEPKPDWEILARRVPEGAREFWPQAKIDSFELSRAGLASKLSESAAQVVVLHYVGYAYARRGVPAWLPGALADWKNGTDGKVVVMFHELYAKGPPWSSTFWLLPAQAWVAHRLARLADHWITSCPDYMRVLTKFLRANPQKGTMIPIGSTIDPVREPDWDRPWPPALGKKFRIVLFGMPLTRLRTLRFHRHLLKLLVERQLVESFVLTGKSDREGEILNEANSILLETGLSDFQEGHFDLSTTELSELLLDQHIGLLHNPYGSLTKSTVFAAYCTHGLLTVIPPEPGTEPGPYVVNDDDRPQECLERLIRTTWRITPEERERFLFRTISMEFAGVVQRMTGSLAS